MLFENIKAKKAAVTACDYFEDHKHFTLNEFRIEMGMTEKQAHKWLAGAVRSGMVKYNKNNNYESNCPYSDMSLEGVDIK